MALILADQNNKLTYADPFSSAALIILSHLLLYWNPPASSRICEGPSFEFTILGRRGERRLSEALGQGPQERNEINSPKVPYRSPPGVSSPHS